MKDFEAVLLKIFKKNLKLKISEINSLKSKKKNIKFNSHKNWDSLSHVIILNEIQKKFKIKINDRNVMNFDNYSKIFKYLIKKL